MTSEIFPVKFPSLGEPLTSGKAAKQITEVYNGSTLRYFHLATPPPMNCEYVYMRASSSVLFFLSAAVYQSTLAVAYIAPINSPVAAFQISMSCIP